MNCETTRNPLVSLRLGHARDEIGRPAQLGKFPQQTANINFISRKTAADCMSIYGKAHSIHSV